ncbi:hypothetical protein [Clostridium phage Maintenon]|nr:hypothetical protein [Clostridium phage Maintenon]
MIARRGKMPLFFLAKVYTYLKIVDCKKPGF